MRLHGKDGRGVLFKGAVRSYPIGIKIPVIVIFGFKDGIGAHTCVLKKN